MSTKRVEIFSKKYEGYRLYDILKISHSGYDSDDDYRYMLDTLIEETQSEINKAVKKIIIKAFDFRRDIDEIDYFEITDELKEEIKQKRRPCYGDTYIKSIKIHQPKNFNRIALETDEIIEYNNGNFLTIKNFYKKILYYNENLPNKSNKFNETKYNKFVNSILSQKTDNEKSMKLLELIRSKFIDNVNENVCDDLYNLRISVIQPR
jgi:hypothetical protein